MQTLWQQTASWRRAPRRLTATRAGVLVLVAAVALGLVAIFSGNNPLFFLWGVVLGGIVVSGVLSEATLRPLSATLEFGQPLRAGEPASVWLHVANTSRLLPALAVTWRVELADAQGAWAPLQSYVLRLGAREQARLRLVAQPRCRGALAVVGLSARTAFPFGLFVKERPFFHIVQAVAPAMVRPLRARGAKLAVSALTRATQAGRARSLQGDDIAQLRDFRPGDGWRRVLWRRVASSGRWLVAEFDGERTHSVVLEVRADTLWPAGAAGEPTRPTAAAYAMAAPESVDGAGRADAARTPGAAAEGLLAFAGSLAEQLAATAASVGLWTHGTSVAVEPGPAQAGRLLDALARVDLRVPVGARPPLEGEVIDVAALWRRAQATEGAAAATRARAAAGRAAAR